MKCLKKWIAITLIMCMTFSMAGCGSSTEHGLSSKKPQSITIWHYYNGALATQFDELVAEFNNTVGKEKGIIVTAESKSSVDDLIAALRDAADQKVGAPKMPNIFQCYLDTAMDLDKNDLLANLDAYVTADEKAEYMDSYIREGSFGEDNAFKLFPVAKSSEILMLNKTDWDKFTADTGATEADLQTWEGLTETAAKYYEWSDGKAFFGRDAFANYMIVGCEQLGKELFVVDKGKATLQFDKGVVRKLWDNYYVPYVKGHFVHVGRFRSDDIKLGEIIALVCSTASAVYFPSKVSKTDGSTYDIDYEVLPLPGFAGTDPYAVQQGASMAVTKSTEQAEYASVVFLKWFTETEQNMKYCVSSGYLPVKKETNTVEAFDEYCANAEEALSGIETDTIHVTLEQIAGGEKLYTNSGFDGGTEARELLNYGMIDMAVADRANILQRIQAGEAEENVLETYLSDAYFDKWYTQTQAELEKICQ
ncbi:MAG: extracellular solute-binding protein [Lachnospiraceae bacterium]|nr:extracellular solute-binding protein [Lachnospiraceae bacterium]